MIGTVIKNRYRIDGFLREDALGTCYSATDMAGRDALTLCILKNDSISKRIEDIIRFRTEIMAASELGADGMARVLEVGEFVGLHFVAMGGCGGKSLAELLNGERPPVDECVRIIMQVCRVLEKAHEGKIVHKDINPSNILLDGDRVTLAGFGYSQIRRFDETVPREHLMEVFRYMAPEQCRVLTRGVDERTDLYSLGAVMYRLLSGRDPFTGSNINSIIYRQVALMPKRPGAINQSVPEMLDRIVLKLLEKEPDNRYQGCRGLLSDLEKYAGGDGAFVLGLEDRVVRMNYRSKLVDRENELGRLVRLCEGAREGRGGGCLVSGEAGSGKTRLIEELKGIVYSSGGFLLEGRCPVQERKVPYEPIREALDAGIHFYHRLSPEERARISGELREEFRSMGEVIIRLNPGMKDLLGECPPMVPLDPERESQRSLMVMASFFLRFSDLYRPLVLLVEDLHWADEGTLNLIAELLGNCAGHPIAIIASFRADEVTGRHGMTRVRRRIEEGKLPVEEIRLEPLGYGDMNRLVSGLIMERESRTAPVAEFIHDRSDGNPFLAIEILKKLVDEKVLVHRGGAWNFDRDLLDDVKIPDSSVEIILSRAKRLDVREVEVISSAAVIGARFSMKLLFGICGPDNAAVVRTVDRATELRLLVRLPEGGEVEFAHDRIRDAFYRSLPGQRRKELHRMVADAIEEQSRDSLDGVIFELAHHCVEAGDMERALIFFYPAGIKAMREYANEDALAYFSRALELQERSGGPWGRPAADLMRCMSKVHLNLGNYDDAIVVLRRALPLLEAPIELAEVHALISNAYLKKGEWKKCQDEARLGLDPLGVSIPASRPAMMLSIMKELAVHAFHSLCPGLYTRPRAVVDEKWEILTKIIPPLTWSYIFSDVVMFVRCTLWGLNTAERRLGESAVLGMARGGYASFLMAIPLFGPALRNHDRALELRKKINDRWGVAQSLQWLGFCWQWKGDCARSFDFFGRSAEMFREIGDIREYAFSIFGSFISRYYTSDYEGMDRIGEEYYAIASKSLDHYGISVYWSWMAKSWLERGELDRAEACGLEGHRLSLEREVWYVHCEVNIVLGHVCLEKGDFGASLEYLRRARELNETNNFLRHYTVHLYPILAEAKMALYASRPASAAGQGALLREIGGDCREALRRTKNWPLNHGLSLLAYARYLALKGSRRRAGRYYARSMELFRKTGRRFNLARSYYEYALFLARYDDLQETRKYLGSAYSIFSGIGAAAYAARTGRLLGIGSPGGSARSMEKLLDGERAALAMRNAREVGLISDPDELPGAAIASAVEIAGAQRGCLYLIDPEGRIATTASFPQGCDCEGPGGHTIALVNRVLRTGKPVIIANAETAAGGPAASTGVKSVLCIPLEARDRVIGACYLDNSLARDLFGDREIELVRTFFANVAVSLAAAAGGRKSGGGEERPSDVLTTPIPVDKLARAKTFMEENFMSDISREGLAALVGIHHDNLGKYFKILYGMRMSDYLNELRIHEAAKRLRETDARIVEIAYAVGFRTMSTFNKAFREVLKLSPAQYRKRRS